MGTHPSPRAVGAGGAAPRRGLGGLLDRLGPRSPDAPDWIQVGLGLALLIGAGVVLGINYLSPDKRMIAVMVATLVFGIAWRMDMVSGIGLLVLALPYPGGTVFGGTNVALVLLLLVIWLLRVTTRQAAPAQRTPVDVPMAALLISFIVSFYNIDSSGNLRRALQNFILIVAGIAMFYLIVNNLRRPEHLERVHLFYSVSIAMVCLLGVYELFYPNAVLIPGWIAFHHSVSEGINIHNVRIGGPFFDFELLSEYCAMNLLLLYFLTVRASGTRRLVFGSLFALTFFIMFATVTRGGMMALGIGLLYFLWMARRSLRVARVVGTVAAATAAFVAMNYLVADFTHSGDLIARFSNPNSWQFENGMPVARSEIWKSAFERMMRHPVIGHGPVYDTAKGIDFWFWPHNGYLYIGNLVGFAGLGCYLWLLLRLWKISRPVTFDLKDPNYARAYLTIAHVQFVVFMVDQVKIDFLRNTIYPFQVWLLFAFIVAAHRLAQPATSAPLPAHARA